MKLVLVLSLALLLAPVALPAAAAAASGDALDAPLCAGLVSVRCAYGNTFCILYTNVFGDVECYHL
jgi:hypothetical protein